MSAKRKLTTLTLREKFDVINAVKSGMKKKDVAAQYGLPPSTLSTIIKNEAKILSEYELSHNLSCKRRRLAKFPDLEKRLLNWFKQCRDKKISVNGPILREQAEEFSKSLGHSSFRASNGWLSSFKKRHGLVFKNGCGESTSVNSKICDEWTVELRSLLKDYEPKDVFNADETGLFFKCLPHKTVNFKGEKCHGGEHSKERLTILLATNMTGTEKLKPLVIGKSKKSCCLSGCKSLPVDYEANEKAWMTAEIFKAWLIKIDKNMINKKRKILLFINYCTAHNMIPPLKAVKVIFFPPDTTSKLRPLDQGIIKDFKTLYRKEIIRKLIVDMEQKSATLINVLHAIRMIDKAWRKVSETTISNCFISCGFSMSQENTPEEPDMNLEELQNIDVEDYATCDNGIATSGTLCDAEVIEKVNKNDDNYDTDDADLADCESLVSNKQTIVIDKKIKIKVIDEKSENSLKQKKITDYFSPRFLLH